MRVSFRLASATVFLLLVPSLHAQSTTPANPAIRSLFLVGDLTPTSSGSTSAGSLATLFAPTKLNVVDRTSPGHSSRNAITTGAWAATLALIKPDDVVLIQFGAHEAEPAAGKDPATAQPVSGASAEATLPGLNDDFRDTLNPITGQRELVHTFGWYLREMVVETIARGATPIICSLAPSESSTPTGAYTDWSRSIATQQRVPFLDLSRAPHLARQHTAISRGPHCHQPSSPSSKHSPQTHSPGFFSPAGDAIPAAAPPPPPPPPPPSALQLPVPPAH